MPKKYSKRRPPWAGWGKLKPNRIQRRRMKKKCGRKCFLGPDISFPICTKNTCRRNKKGIASAYIRAKQWGKPRAFYKTYWGRPHMKRVVYTRVAKKARRLLGWDRRKTRIKRKKAGRRARKLQKRH